MKDFFLNLILGSLMAPIRAWPETRLNRSLVHFGRAFGPPNIRHFSELAPDEQNALLARVPDLKLPHTDFPRPLQWIPRTALVWTGDAPTVNDVIVGENVRDPLKPIPQPGESYVVRGFMTSTTIDKWHTRLGFRWDDNWQLFILSAALKRIP